ncbi:transposase [Cooperia oncophora]
MLTGPDRNPLRIEIPSDLEEVFVWALSSSVAGHGTVRAWIQVIADSAIYRTEAACEIHGNGGIGYPASAATHVPRRTIIDGEVGMSRTCLKGQCAICDNKPENLITAVQSYSLRILGRDSVWWDWKGVAYYELLQPGKTMNSASYCAQLDLLNEAIKEKRPELASNKGIVFHHNNSRPLTSLITRNKLKICSKELGWEVFMHPPHSPDLAPFDCHLFPSLRNSLDGKKLTDRSTAENYSANFFADKPEKFYTKKVMKLPHKWQKVKNNIVNM